MQQCSNVSTLESACCKLVCAQPTTSSCSTFYDKEEKQNPAPLHAVVQLAQPVRAAPLVKTSTATIMAQLM